MKRVIVLNIITLLIMAIYVAIIQCIKSDIVSNEFYWFMSNFVILMLYLDFLLVLCALILSFRNKQYISLLIISILFAVLLILNDYVFVQKI